jgi:hypothetical protein
LLSGAKVSLAKGNSCLKKKKLGSRMKILLFPEKIYSISGKFRGAAPLYKGQPRYLYLNLNYEKLQFKFYNYRATTLNLAYFKSRVFWPKSLKSTTALRLVTSPSREITTPIPKRSCSIVCPTSTTAGESGVKFAGAAFLCGTNPAGGLTLCCAPLPAP